VKAPSGLPLEAEEARQAVRPLLSLPGADGIEAVITGSRTGLTRYARSEIIQNTVKEELRAYVRVVVGDRVASSATNQLDPDSLRSAAAKALEAARASRPDAEFPGLADPEVVGGTSPLFRWDDAVASASASERARAVSEVLKITSGAEAAGIFETSAHAFGIFSSTGMDRFDAYTRCMVTCLTDRGKGATGWGEGTSHRREEVDVEAAARRALKKASAAQKAVDVEPDAYEVILEPAAVATLLDYLSYCGFGAKQVLEGESFLAERAGRQVAARDVTVADDVFHDGSIGPAFDLEGVGKKRVAVIDAGKATRPVTDLRTAAKLGVESTGHYSGSNEFGPYAAQVVLEAGSEDFGDLLSSVDDGLLVTRFHYVNVLDRPQTLLTGMTRDGTFRIRRGELAEPARNLRFTQSVLDALAAVSGIGGDSTTFAPEYSAFGSTVAPSLRVGEFHFTSRTSH
jgi:PmbA protein